MAHVKIQYDVMDAFCMDVFQKFGFTKDESRIISDVLLLSDVYGIESHGAQRLTRVTVFIIPARTGAFMCSKLPSICSRISL